MVKICGYCYCPICNPILVIFSSRVAIWSICNPTSLEWLLSKVGFISKTRSAMLAKSVDKLLFMTDNLQQTKQQEAHVIAPGGLDKSWLNYPFIMSFWWALVLVCTAAHLTALLVYRNNFTKSYCCPCCCRWLLLSLTLSGLWAAEAHSGLRSLTQLKVKWKAGEFSKLEYNEQSVVDFGLKLEILILRKCDVCSDLFKRKMISPL